MPSLDRVCVRCGSEFEGRTGAQYCSPACRQRAYRERVKNEAEAGDAIEQSRMIQEMAAALSRERIDAYLPRTRLQLYNMLKLAMKDLKAASDADELDGLISGQARQRSHLSSLRASRRRRKL